MLNMIKKLQYEHITFLRTTYYEKDISGSNFLKIDFFEGLTFKHLKRVTKSTSERRWYLCASCGCFHECFLLYEFPSGNQVDGVLLALRWHVARYMTF